MTLKCIAHRGGPLSTPTPLPENSIAAITRALSLGVDAIEIDIFQVGGELLVTHDRRLGRTVSGEGVITDLSLDYIRQQQLANGEPVPTLQQILALIGNQVLLNIEIKGANTLPRLVQVLRDYVNSTQGSYEQYLISSFDHQQLFQAMQQLPEVKRGVLIEGIPLDYAACCEPLKAYAFNTHLSFITPELLADARKRGLQNWVYTVNHEDDWLRMRELGVDAVFTDRPDALIAFNQG
jgi:glycerophosphoryl diester phosphodiesterase